MPHPTVSGWVCAPILGSRGGCWSCATLHPKKSQILTKLLQCSALFSTEEDRSGRFRGFWLRMNCWHVGEDPCRMAGRGCGETEARPESIDSIPPPAALRTLLLFGALSGFLMPPDVQSWNQVDGREGPGNLYCRTVGSRARMLVPLPSPCGCQGDLCWRIPSGEMGCELCVWRGKNLYWVTIQTPRPWEHPCLDGVMSSRCFGAVLWDFGLSV